MEDISFLALAVALLIIIISLLWRYVKNDNLKNDSLKAKHTTMNSSKGVLATSAGQKEKKDFEKQASETLRDAKIDGDTVYEVEFGLFGKVGKHRAVLINVLNQEKLAFRLDLCVDSSKRENCPPCPKCDKQFESYEEYFDHITTDHIKEGFFQKCCGEKFYDVLSYREHEYKGHYNTDDVTSVSLSFTQIGNVKFSYDQFMEKKKDSICLYSAYKKKITFKDILGAGLSIIQHFGNYYMFFWNCQDFAAWFLTFNGIPLKEIDPTATDKVTGSGSSQGSVQNTKGWLLYKDLEPKDKQKFEVYFPGVVYTCETCPWLPPMKLKELMRHDELAHPEE